MRRGVPCHTREEALEAASGGADFIQLGPIFPTPSKATYGPPAGPVLIRQVRPAVACPILAVGGVTAHNAGEALEAGGDGGGGPLPGGDGRPGRGRGNAGPPGGRAPGASADLRAPLAHPGGRV